MFFQETTPDTSGYMIAGYAIAFIVMALYVASMYVRARNLKQDMTTLEEMEESQPGQGNPSRQSDKVRQNLANNQPTNLAAKNTRKNY